MRISTCFYTNNMTKRWLTIGVICIALLLVLGCLWLERTVRPHNQITHMSEQKVIAPAHEIPPQVAQNMQEALAAREEKLKQLEQTTKANPKENGQ